MSAYAQEQQEHQHDTAADRVVDAVRRRVAVPKDVMDAAKQRRDRVTELAGSHDAARAIFNSGSVAHGTANAPLHDTDGGVVLDRRSYWDYGPDGGDLPPRPLMESFRDWILPRLRRHYPDVTCEITKRALLFEFHEPLDVDNGEPVDPSVDLIVALDRRGAPGLWIPNTERPGWDPSHPQRHTELFVETERELRVHRARLVRLVKVAVKNDGDRKVMCSFNVEALALDLVEQVEPLAAGLAGLLLGASRSIARSLTDDPAHVSGPIKLPGHVTRERAADRLEQLGQIVADSLDARSTALARRVLSGVFGPQIDDIRENEARSLHRALDRREGAAAAALLGSTRPHKPRRSYGA